MAENRVIIEGGWDASGVAQHPLPVSGTFTPSGTQNVLITGQPISTLTSTIPGFTGSYLYSLDDTPGVVAANSFLSLFNPVGSGKKMYYLGSFISTYVVSGASTTRESMQGHAITAASAGTLMGAASIFKLDSTYGASAAQVRTGNPTVTVGPNVFNSPPPINTTVGQYVHSVGYGLQTFGGPVVFREGEGVVFQTDAGNINQTWNISIVWAEGV